jgi:REP element-mobilizing transposase RayT
MDIDLKLRHSQASSLYYACLLIPRDPLHQLKNGLDESLPLWLEQICARHKWKMGFTVIDPDCFQWGIQLVSTMHISQFINVIRRETSALILQNRENLRNVKSNDFWAQGYLVVSGTRPLSREIVEQGIRLLRRK